MTMGDFCGWGYMRHNPNWKTTSQLLTALVSAAAGEGNFLLNIGPKPDGSIRREEVVRLRAMGRWLKLNGEAIYGSQRCDLNGGLGGKANIINNWTMIGNWTRKGNIGYLHIVRWPGTEAVVPLVKTKALSARLLGTGQRLKVRQEHNGRLILSGLPSRPPHPAINVVAVTFVGEPHRLAETNPAAWIEGKAR
jgi:alpha-L-fucosidase